VHTSNAGRVANQRCSRAIFTAHDTIRTDIAAVTQLGSSDQYRTRTNPDALPYFYRLMNSRGHQAESAVIVNNSRLSNDHCAGAKVCVVADANPARAVKYAIRANYDVVADAYRAIVITPRFPATMQQTPALQSNSATKEEARRCLNRHPSFAAELVRTEFCQSCR
jgi:hypothetical protein